MTKVESNPENLRVSKANKLNEAMLIESGSKLSLYELKVILSVVSQISPKDKDFKDYRITIPELVAITHIDKHNLYRDIRKICKNLMSSIITIKEPNDPDGFVMVSWFAHAKYSKVQGYVEFSISPKLKPYLLNLRDSGNFTFYHLSQILKLSSVYSIRTYELLRQFLPIGEVKKGTKSRFRYISIEDYRAYIGVTQGKYKVFKDFRKRVLDPVKKELEEKTDIIFDYEVIRKGRKLYAINFNIKHSEKFEAVEDDSINGEIDILHDLDQTLVNYLKSNIDEMLDKQIVLICNNYEKDIIIESIIDFVGSKARGNIDINESRYFMAVLSKKNAAYQAVQAANRPKTTDEKLNDKSWADGMDDEFDMDKPIF